MEKSKNKGEGGVEFKKRRVKSKDSRFETKIKKWRWNRQNNVSFVRNHGEDFRESRITLGRC